MKGKSPAFQLYPNDLLNDEAVKLMDNREFGIYWKLICHNWTEKSIPAELDKLAVLVNEDPRDFEEMWKKMAFKFRKIGQRLTNNRVERERSKQRGYAKAQKEKMKSYWEKLKSKRMASHKLADSQLIPARARSSSSVSSSSSVIKQTTDMASPAGAIAPPILASDLIPKDEPILRKDPVSHLVRAWKSTLGVAKEDKVWDKKHWPRCSAAAKDLLSIFDGDKYLAADCMVAKHEEFTKSGLSFTLETIVRHAHEWRHKNGNKSS